MYPIETRLETVIGVASVITSQVQFHVESYGFNTKEGNFGGFSYQFTKKLNAGDKIELFMKFGDVFILAFTGWMLDENLAL